MNEPFGFNVRRTQDGGWSVALPHQCDDWEITGEKYGPGVPQQLAIQELTDFIAEASEALAALKAGREFGDAT